MTQSNSLGGKLRFVLYAALFALVLIGFVSESYVVLVILALVGIVVAIIADRLENANSEPYKSNNRLHHL